MKDNRLPLSLAAGVVVLVAFTQLFSQGVPNHRGVVEDVLKAGHYNIDTHEGQAAFVDAAVVALHKKDERWGHLKKNPGQTQIHGHAEDAALYLADAGLSQAVDFIGGAGAPGARVAWSVDQPRYSRADWLDPHEHGGVVPPTPPLCPPPPPAKPYPGDAFFTDALGTVLAADYAEAGQTLNAGSATWFSRTIWRHVNEGMSMEQSTAQSRKEWRAALGLP